MIVFAEELFSDVIEEAKPLLERHWEEIAINKDTVPLDPDYDTYSRLSSSGVLKVYTVRADNILMGYSAYVVMPHPHYKSTIFAKCDLFWLSQECRGAGVGIRFMKFIEEKLRESGVHVMTSYSKVAHPALGKLLEHLGHTEIERNFSKVLKV